MWLRQRSTAWCPSACHCRPPINEMPQRPGVSQKNIDRWNHRDFDCFCTLCRDQFWGPPGVGTGSQSAWRTHEPRRWATARLIHSWPKPTRVPCGRKPPGAGKVSASMRGYADSRQLHPTPGSSNDCSDVAVYPHRALNNRGDGGRRMLEEPLGVSSPSATKLRPPPSPALGHSTHDARGD